MCNNMPFTREQLIDIKTIIKETISELLQDDKFISLIADKVQQKINIGDMKKNIIILEQKIDCLEKQNAAANIQLNDMQQMHKRNNLRIIGLQEDDNENTEEKVMHLLNNKLKINLPDGVINECRRIGPKNKSVSKSRVTLVNLSRCKYKHLIIKYRKLLKGTKIVITEDLSKESYSLFKDAVRELGRDVKVWSMDGNIYTVVNNTKYKIKNVSEISDIKQKIANAL